MVSSGQLKDYVGWGRPEKITCEYSHGSTSNCWKLERPYLLTRCETTGTFEVFPSLRFPDN